MKPPFIFTTRLDDDKKYGAFCCYLLLLIVYVIVGAIYLIKAYSDFGNNTIEYFLLLDNWRQPTISDILPVYNTSTCPAGYSFLIPYVWGGSETGCDCRNANSVKKIKEAWSDIGITYCTIDQKFWGCNDISSLPSRAMPNWFNSTLWCKKTSQDTFMNTASMVDFSGECKIPQAPRRRKNIQEDTGRVEDCRLLHQGGGAEQHDSRQRSAGERADLYRRIQIAADAHEIPFSRQDSADQECERHP